MARLLTRIKRTRRGDYEIRLPAAERDLLRTLPGQLRDLLGTDDPALARLFPPSRTDDPVEDEEYRRLVHDDLVQERRRAAELMESTLEAERLDEEHLSAWLSTINDVRLILGTRLDVTEDMYGHDLSPDDPRAPAFGVYSYLSVLEEQIVEAMAGGLPRGGDRG